MKKSTRLFRSERFEMSLIFGPVNNRERQKNLHNYDYQYNLLSLETDQLLHMRELFSNLFTQNVFCSPIISSELSSPKLHFFLHAYYKGLNKLRLNQSAISWLMLISCCAAGSFDRGGSFEHNSK